MPISLDVMEGDLMDKYIKAVKKLSSWLRRAAAVLVTAMIMITAVGCAEDNMARVDFMANGGTGTTKQIVTDQVSNVKLNANAFTRDGYVFTGWNTEPDGSGTSYSNEALVKLALNNSLILYAQWKKDDGTETSSDNTETKKEDTTAAIADSGTVTAQKAEPTPTPTPTTNAAQKASSNISTANQSSSAAIKKKTWHDRVTLPIYEDRPIYENRPVYEQQPVYEDQPEYETKTVNLWRYSYSTATYDFSPIGDQSSGYYDSEDQAKNAANATVDNLVYTRMISMLEDEWFASTFPVEKFDPAKVKYTLDVSSDGSDPAKYIFSYTKICYTYTLPSSFVPVVSNPDYDDEQTAKAAGNAAALAAGKQWYDSHTNFSADDYNPDAFTFDVATSQEAVQKKVATGNYVRVQVGTAKVQVGTESVVVGSEKVYVGDQVVQEEGWY